MAHEAHAGILLDKIHPGLHPSNPSAAHGLSAPALGPQWSSWQATDRTEMVEAAQPELAPTQEALALVNFVLAALMTWTDTTGAAKALLFNTLLLFRRE